MSSDERLIYEARMRTRMAIVAVGAGVLLLGSAILQLSGPHTSINELTIGLIYANKRHVLDLIASVLNALSLLGLVVTLNYLWGAARARNEQLQSFIRILAIAGGVLAAISAVANAILIASKAHDFVTTGLQTYPEANHLTSSGGLVVFQYAGLLGDLLLAMGLVLISLHAMRVGLLTRFLGYLGIFAGVLMVFPLVQIPVVEVYWLLAVGYLLSGRWPSGVPPAWRSGRAERWPSSAEMREQRMRAGGRGSGRGAPVSAPAPAAEAVGAPTPSARTRAATPKRKRKRRR